MSMQQRIDSALACLVQVAGHFSIPADYGQLSRAYIVDESAVDTVGLMTAARAIGFRTRCFDHATMEQIRRVPKPAVIRFDDGRYVVLFGINDEQAAVFDPMTEQKRFLVTPSFLEEHWNGEIILFAKTYKIKAVQMVQKFGFGWFTPVIRRYKTFLMQVLGMSLLLQFLGLLGPLFAQVIIDRVLSHHSLSTLDMLLGGMILVTLFQQWILGLRQYLFINTTSKIDTTLSAHLFRKVTELPIKYFDKWQVGDVVSRMYELETIRNFLTGASLTVVLDILFAVVYLVVMFLYSATLSYIVWVTIPLFLILNAVVAPIFKERLNKHFLLQAEQNSFVIESVTGMRTLKTMGVERTFVDRYEGVLARALKASFSVVNVATVSGSISLFLQSAYNLAILWIGATLAMDGEIMVGQLIAFQMLAGMVIAPIMRLANIWQYFQQIRVSMERMADIMDEESEPAFDPNRTTLPSLRGEIVFHNVNFRYKADSKNVLTDVSFRIPPGLRVGIVGRSGSGKSTLTKLMQRLYTPDSGRVLVDGVDIAQVETAWLRRQIGIVLQENFLFGGSIAENIRIAKPNATMEEVVAAAKLAGADEFISEMPHGYDTYVGERGSLLSGGQRQRVAIARALILDPRIIIFDEATSALDTESEAHIMKSLDQIAKGRTLIMIAHRLSTVRDCNAIIAMDKGKIIEAGSHDQLMAKKGYYYHLYGAQE